MVLDQPAAGPVPTQDAAAHAAAGADGQQLQDADGAPLTIPLPMVQVIRHCQQSVQAHLLHTVLGLPADEPHVQHQPILSVDDLTVAGMRYTMQDAQTLVHLSYLVMPEQQEKHRLIFRDRVWALVSDPVSSRAAMALSLFILVCICATTLAYSYESLPEAPRTQTGADVLDMIETVSSITFTVEYGLRLLTCPDLRRFLMSPLNLVDLLAIVPFYIELLLRSTMSCALRFVCCCSSECFLVTLHAWSQTGLGAR
jgi:Ion transport protein